MHESQRLVAKFHRALEHPVSERPCIMRPMLRGSLILEEALETVYALYRAHGWSHENARTVILSELRVTLARLQRMQWDDFNLLTSIADGLCDLKYVLDGTAVEMGLDLDPLFAEVHRANMSKIGGERRPDGKTLKPAGWQPPQLAKIIEQQLREGIKYDEPDSTDPGA